MIKYFRTSAYYASSLCNFSLDTSLASLLDLKKLTLIQILHSSMQWLKWYCEAGGGAHLTKPDWSKPHTHSNPTNLALFRHKITLHRFNQGAHTIAGGLKWVQGGWAPRPLTLTTGSMFTLSDKCGRGLSSMTLSYLITF